MGASQVSQNGISFRLPSNIVTRSFLNFSPRQISRTDSFLASPISTFRAQSRVHPATVPSLLKCKYIKGNGHIALWPFISWPYIPLSFISFCFVSGHCGTTFSIKISSHMFPKVSKKYSFSRSVKSIVGSPGSFSATAWSTTLI